MAVTRRKSQMPQADDDKNGAKHKPNWVDIWTFIVLTVTLVVGLFYAGFAFQQNELTRVSLDIASRPLLSAGFEMPIPAPQAGKIWTTHIRIENLGKSPTKAHIRTNIVYSLTKIDSPPLSTKERIQLVWPGKGVGELSESDDPITDGQINDMKAGRGWLYQRALITYDHYFTAICTESTIKANPTQSDGFIVHINGICSDQKSTDAS